MQIEVKGRNVTVTDELREWSSGASRRSASRSAQLAVLEVELSEERNPANPDSHVAEATLHLKGVTLRARDASRDIKHSINLIADEHGPPGQAPPRQAARAAGRRGAAAGRCRSSRRWPRRRAAPRRRTDARADVSRGAPRPGPAASIL